MLFAASRSSLALPVFSSGPAAVVDVALLWFSSAGPLSNFWSRTPVCAIVPRQSRFSPMRYDAV